MRGACAGLPGVRPALAPRRGAGAATEGLSVGPGWLRDGRAAVGRARRLSSASAGPNTKGGRPGAPVVEMAAAAGVARSACAAGRGGGGGGFSGCSPCLRAQRWPWGCGGGPPPAPPGEPPRRAWGLEGRSGVAGVAGGGWRLFRFPTQAAWLGHGVRKRHWTSARGFHCIDQSEARRVSNRVSVSARQAPGTRRVPLSRMLWVRTCMPGAAARRRAPVRQPEGASVEGGLGEHVCALAGGRQGRQGVVAPRLVHLGGPCGRRERARAE